MNKTVLHPLKNVFSSTLKKHLVFSMCRLSEHYVVVNGPTEVLEVFCVCSNVSNAVPVQRPGNRVKQPPFVSICPWKLEGMCVMFQTEITRAITNK